MITAEFLPACPSAWHRLLHELVVAGRLSDIPGATWPPLVWFALPAALFVSIAVVASAARSPRALVLVLAASGFVSLWLPLALAPLLLNARPWPPATAWRTTVAIAIAIVATAFVATPPCDRSV